MCQVATKGGVVNVEIADFEMGMVRSVLGPDEFRCELRTIVLEVPTCHTSETSQRIQSLDIPAPLFVHRDNGPQTVGRHTCHTGISDLPTDVTTRSSWSGSKPASLKYRREKAI